MKTNFLRVLLVVLALVLCLSVFAACNDPEPGTNPGTNPGTTPGGTTPGGDEGKPEVQEVLPSVSEGTNFSTYTNNVVNVLHYTNEGAHEAYIPWDEICPSTGMEISPGDLIGDKIYDRTAWLEENYGIVMGCEYLAHGPDFVTRVRSMIETNSQDYQMVDYFAFGAQKLMGQEYFLNMNDVEYIDFEDPWWVDSAIEALSLGEYVEFAVSDMLLLDKGATTLIYYNIGMAEDLGIEDLYDLVRNGEWTIEALAEYAALAHEDDGDDNWDHKDIYGISNGDDPVHNLYIGSGYKFISKDENGEFYYQYRTEEETTDIMITILEDVMYADWYWNSWIKRDLGGENQPKFDEGKALFSFSKAKGCLTLRDMVDDYGILPIPKYSADQDQYYSQVSNYHDSLFAIPMSALGNTEIIGAAIELMSYYSYYNIYNDFFEIVIQNRGTRDAESKEMLGLIFSTRTYDMGLLYDPVGITDQVLRYTNTGETGVISFWDQEASRLEKAMEDLNALADKYNQ
ncbi:MAG: hypothetical protein IKC97_02060 [Clostridia bacterium]|nr:hypothetical protein [Clostridia bacterium]